MLFFHVRPADQPKMTGAALGHKKFRDTSYKLCVYDLHRTRISDITMLWQEFEPRTVRSISEQEMSSKYATWGFDASAVLHLNQQEVGGFSAAVLVERTAPRASARSSLRTLWRAACGNSLQVPTITLRHHGETKTVIKKLPDDSSEDRCLFP